MSKYRHSLKEELTIYTLDEYVKFLDRFKDCDLILFRGQRFDWPLLPKIARITLKKNLLDGEIDIFDTFVSRSLPYIEIDPDNDWDWLAIAQHHGLPTRLLDWTTNGLAALWFCVGKPPFELNVKNSGVVWAFEPEEEDIIDHFENDNPFEMGNRTKVFRPDHIIKTIVSQSGWFTVHPFIEKRSAFVPLDNNINYKECLTKINVPAEKFSSLRKQLDLCGINHESLFPDIEGLCKYVEWKNAKLSDE